MARKRPLQSMTEVKPAAIENLNRDPLGRYIMNDRGIGCLWIVPNDDPVARPSLPAHRLAFVVVASQLVGVSGHRRPFILAGLNLLAVLAGSFHVWKKIG